MLVATKVDAFTAPLEPGDPVGYLVTITNTGNAPATNVVFVDDIETASSGLLTRSGAITPSQGTATPLANGVSWDVGTIAGGGATATIMFAVTVDTPWPAGVDEVENQGIVSPLTWPISELTDDPDAGGAADPTVSPVTAGPDVAVSKDDNVVGSVSTGGIDCVHGHC